MSDVWKIGIEIGLQNSASAGLALLTREVLGLNGHVENLIAKFKELDTSTKQILGGGLAVGVGAGLAAGLWAATKAGSELVKTMGQLQNLGKSVADIQMDTNSAIQAQIAIHGSSAASNLKVLRELSGVTATSDDARAILQDTLKAGVVVSNLIGGNPEDYIQTLVKTAELRGDGVDPKTGKIDPDRLIAGVKSEVATLVAAGGLIKPGDLMMMVQQAGPMARMDSDPNKFWQSMITAMMDMTGRRAGTADTALGRQLLGEKMGLSTAMQMEADGLFKAGSVHKAGTGVKIDDGGLVGEDILKGPGGMQAWMEGVLIPQFKAHGITDQAAQMQELYKVFGTETARRMAALFITSQAQIAKDAGLQDAASKQNLYGNVMGTDLGANMSGLSGALHGFFEVLGAPMVKPAIAGLTFLTSGVNQLLSILSAHPDLAGVAGAVGATGAAALIGGGAYTMGKGLMTGFGLTTSAAALNTSAVMLNEAAVSLGAGSVEKTAAASLATSLGWFGKARLGLAAFGGLLGLEGLAQMTDSGDDATLAKGASESQRVRAKYGDDLLRAARSAYVPWYGSSNINSEDGHDQSYVNQYLDNQRNMRRGYTAPSFPQPDYNSLTRDRSAHGAALSGNALDLSKLNITMPPIEQKVEIKPAPVILDGRVLAQLIQSALVKAGSIVSGGQGFDGTAMPRAAGQ